MTEPTDVEVFADLGCKLDAVQASIDAETGKREEEIRAANKSAAAANAAADQSRKKARRATVFGLLAGLAAILSLFVGVKAQATADDIVAARKDGRAAVCDEVSALVEALLAASPPGPDPAATQAKVDRFTEDLQSRSGPLGCKFHFTIPGG